MRVVVFRSADADFFLPHVDMRHIAEYTAAAATSGGPDDISLGALHRRLTETRPVTAVAGAPGAGRRRTGTPYAAGSPPRELDVAPACEQG
ncbi:hypothetical protein ACIHCM_09885 [Streptomyces sp. NPDC052023]|uniref:hypothetical protein n=1 Tax=Streptomyces sp. NPDC052023 TaxID=3365681 RepID=UPI0037D4F518